MSRFPRAISSLSRSPQSLLATSIRVRPRTPRVQANFSAQHAKPILEDLPSYTTSRESDDDARFSTHLNAVFPSLEFPPELARRMLTHGSHRDAIHGHNGRLGFVGRRVLESYLLLFANEVTGGRAHYDYDHLVSRALNTYFMGEHVAPQWALGSVVLWVPTASKETLQIAQSKNPNTELDEAIAASPGVAKSVGLYKVMGEAVQAVIGGVYHQFGGSVAHRLFHTRVLPCLLTKSRGIPEEFLATALQICGRMGGPECNLLYGINPPACSEEEHIQAPLNRRAAAAGL